MYTLLCCVFVCVGVAGRRICAAYCMLNGFGVYHFSFVMQRSAETSRRYIVSTRREKLPHQYIYI